MSRASELVRLLFLAGSYNDGGDRAHISGLEHGLRVASMARRHSPEDREMVFVALVHDIARPLSDPFHGEVIAEIVRDLVSDIRYHVLRTHGQYQAFYAFNQGDTFIGASNPWHLDAIQLYAWEVGSFSNDYPLYHQTMVLHEAQELIHEFCGDRQ